MTRPLAFLLWLRLSAVIVAAFHWAPLAAGFKGESSRIRQLKALDALAAR